MILQTLHVHTRRDWWKWPTPYSNHLVNHRNSIYGSWCCLPFIHTRSWFLGIGWNLQKSSSLLKSSQEATLLLRFEVVHRCIAFFWNYSSWVLVSHNQISFSRKYVCLCYCLGVELIYTSELVSESFWQTANIANVVWSLAVIFMLISLVHVVFSGQNHPKPVRWWKISKSPTSLPLPKPSEACKRIFVERMIFRFSSPISSVVPAVGLQDMAGNDD